MMKVQGHPDLRRTSNGAIVNINREKIRTAKHKKKIAEDREKQIDEMFERIEKLEKRLFESLDYIEKNIKDGS